MQPTVIQKFEEFCNNMGRADRRKQRQEHERVKKEDNKEKCENRKKRQQEKKNEKNRAKAEDYDHDEESEEDEERKTRDNVDETATDLSAIMTLDRLNLLVNFEEWKNLSACRKQIVLSQLQFRSYSQRTR